MRLQDKVAVITGAASGMGLAMAQLFTKEGAKVVGADWNAERLDAAVASIQESGGTIVGVQGNIADQATAEHLVDFAFDTYGRLDILCNNAGVMDYMHGVGEMPDDIWRRVLGINLDGPMVHQPPGRATHDRARRRLDHQYRLQPPGSAAEQPEPPTRFPSMGWWGSPGVPRGCTPPRVFGAMPSAREAPRPISARRCPGSEWILSAPRAPRSG